MIKILQRHLRISESIEKYVLKKERNAAVLRGNVLVPQTYEIEVINHEILHNGRFPAIHHQKL